MVRFSIDKRDIYDEIYLNLIITSIENNDYENVIKIEKVSRLAFCKKLILTLVDGK